MPQPGEATAWIMNQPCFSDLSLQEQNEAGSFSFIWGIFELRVMQVLKKTSNESMSRATCREYAKSEFIPQTDVSGEISYFRSLFFSKDGRPTEVWNNAWFRKGDQSEEIRDILLQPQCRFEEEAEALTRIVLRLRNNFFHGFKWAYHLRGQLDNFVHASSIMVKLMPEA